MKIDDYDELLAERERIGLAPMMSLHHVRRLFLGAEERLAAAEAIAPKLRQMAQGYWPDRKDFAEHEAGQVYRDYILEWASVVEWDYDWLASHFITCIAGRDAPWLYKGLKAGCGDELHSKVESRLRGLVEAAKEKK